MIDLHTEEQAALYVAGLLDGREQQAFEALLERHPELQERVRQMSDDLALLALDAPSVAPPAEALRRIRREIRQAPPAASPRHLLALVNRIPAVWPMAACLALSCAVFLLVAERVGDPSPGEAELDPPRPVPSRYELTRRLIQREAELSNLRQALARPSAASTDQEQQLAQVRQELVSTQRELSTWRTRAEQSRRDLDELLDRSIAYHDTNSGVARLVVIELADSQTASQIQGFGTTAQALFARTGDPLLGQILNTRVARDNPRAANLPAAPATADQLAREALATNGTILGFNTLTSANSYGSLITTDGTISADINATTAVALAGNVTVIDNLRTGATSTSGVTLNSGAAASGTGGSYAPSGFTIWDEKAQVGTLNVYDLPNLPAQKDYQLWMVDPGESLPVNIGVLPDLPGGSGQVYFQSNRADLTPTDIFITVEPAGGSNLPTGSRVLQGTGTAAAP